MFLLPNSEDPDQTPMSQRWDAMFIKPPNYKHKTIQKSANIKLTALERPVDTNPYRSHTKWVSSYSSLSYISKSLKTWQSEAATP